MGSKRTATVNSKEQIKIRTMLEDCTAEKQKIRDEVRFFKTKERERRKTKQKQEGLHQITR